MSKNDKTSKIFAKLEDSRRGHLFRVNLLSNEDIEFVMSPMTVKDQKTLIANSSDSNFKDRMLAMVQVLSNCTINPPIDIGKLTMPDFIWLFINLRKNSLGNIVELNGKCSNPDCRDLNTPIKLDLNDITIKSSDGKLIDNTIEILSGLFIKLKFPVVNDFVSGEDTTGKLEDDTLIFTIGDIENEGEIIDFTFIEKEQLLDRIETSKLKHIEKFQESNDFGIDINIEFKCGHCDKDNNVELGENLINFL
jgi:hypothetical protein